MAMSRPMMAGLVMARPMAAARVMAAMAVTARLLRLGCGFGHGICGWRPIILAAHIGHVLRDAMVAPRHRAENGQTLIVGVRRLDFFAIVNAARSSF